MENNINLVEEFENITEVEEVFEEAQSFNWGKAGLVALGVGAVAFAVVKFGKPAIEKFKAQREFKKLQKECTMIPVVEEVEDEEI